MGIAVRDGQRARWRPPTWWGGERTDRARADERRALVGIFPNRGAGVRLFGALLAEQNDEWLVGHRYFSETSLRKLVVMTDGGPTPQLEDQAV